MKRRKFIKSLSYSAGALSLATFPYAMYAQEKKLYPYDRVILGNTDIETSRMAMGTGTSGWGGSSNQTRRLGIKGLSDLLRAAFDEGLTFWDSADGYGSHRHLREALKKINREDVTILTKSTAKDASSMKRDLDRFRKEIGTDYLDVVLLHAVTNPNWRNDYRGAMEVLSEAKASGLIRAHGISCHSIGALREAAVEPWVDLDLARFNPGARKMDADVDTVRNVLQQMEKNGTSVMGMKVYGAGSLLHMKDECLQFQAGHPFIQSFTLGIESYEQLTDVLKRFPAASVRA